MLSKKNRLSNIQNKGDFFKSELFDFKVSDGTEEDPKFAFIVSKKVSKSAVLRNKTKRILAEAIRKNLEQVKNKIKVTITARKTLDKYKTDEIEKLVLEEFKKADILK